VIASNRAIWSILAGLVLALPTGVRASPIQDYLTLGDSLAFGETNTIPTSFGDQGYVKPYADFLARQNDGVRPTVISLAFPGETSTSFFTGVSPPGFAPHTSLDAFNLNYLTDPAQTQNSLMLATIAAEQAAGHVITHVSFSLGTNDLIAFEALHLDFFSLTPVQQQALVKEFFATLTGNYTTVLSELRTVLPHAQILLLNSYNAAAIFGPTDPFNIISEIFDAGQTAMIDSLAGPFDATPVDIHDAFVGHEVAYTFILSGDAHPNAAGYAAMAAQMDAASAPEPSSAVLLVPALWALTCIRKCLERKANGKIWH
jgi:lysophospholipase L1-like esterase